MSVKAKLNHFRISPRKARLVADLIRGKKVQTALNQLDVLIKKSSDPIKKLLNQAVANAEKNFQLKKDNLYISKITVDEGPTLKRWMPRARGRADQIMKRTSHISLELDIIEEDKKIIKKPTARKEVSKKEIDGLANSPQIKVEKPKKKKEALQTSDKL